MGTVQSGVGTAMALVRACRPRQWPKNLLVLAAPLAAGTLVQRQVLVPTLLALAAFILASAATYLVNDVRDRVVDRDHPTKGRRPIAAGEVSPALALATAAVTGIAAVGLSLWVRPQLALVVVTYLAITLAYSWWLKDEPVIELAFIAAGFLLRAVAGGVAADIPLSSWFLLVTGFASLMIAAAKRFGELLRVETVAAAGPESGADRPAARRASLRGYTASYLRFVWTAAAAVTITTYCLWAVEVGQPEATFDWALVSVIPFTLAILRLGVDMDSGGVEAPEDALYRDPVIVILGLSWLVLFAAGALGW